MGPFGGNERMRGGILPAVQAGPAFVQGHRIARTIPRLAEAGGPGAGPYGRSRRLPFRFLAIGDSIVAGAGAPSAHAVALRGQRAVGLSARQRVPVAWEAADANGATMERIWFEELGLAREPDPDMVVLVAGPTDARAGPDAVGNGLPAVLADFVEPGRKRETVVAGTPPFRYFPALPAPLNEFLERRRVPPRRGDGRGVQGAGRGICVICPWTRAGEAYFAVDRFHPSAAGYGHRAGHLLSALQQHRAGPG